MPLKPFVTSARFGMSDILTLPRGQTALYGVCGGHVAACLIFTLRLAAVMLVTSNPYDQRFRLPRACQAF